MAKEKKQRTDNYDEKLAINSAFEDLIKVSLNHAPPRKEPAKAAKKKK